MLRVLVPPTEAFTHHSEQCACLKVPAHLARLLQVLQKLLESSYLGRKIEVIGILLQLLQCRANLSDAAPSERHHTPCVETVRKDKRQPRH